jgi:hypothetical protein
VRHRSPGLKLVQRRKYAIEDSRTGKDVSWIKPFHQTARPGERFTMSMIFNGDWANKDDEKTDRPESRTWKHQHESKNSTERHESKDAEQKRESRDTVQDHEIKDAEQSHESKDSVQRHESKCPSCGHINLVDDSDIDVSW